MVLPLLLGITLAFWGLAYIGKYVAYSNGIKIKGTVVKGAYKRQGNGLFKMMLAELTYTYQIEGATYSNTVITDTDKYQQKTLLMHGEYITVLVNKNKHSDSTINSPFYYLKRSIFLLFIGVIIIFVAFT
ncbi:DUF3592 domain-containing protein [Euzebyella saccharophila]|uniref:DUF3592 domain-containing protein n=1 Tax=Euzebyella saccharophila TaxID=679664 RepID=A0ABV8JUC1_9FLAO|nr:DUF3592 domain-containing protein [Euzebyella saccharophila]